MKPVSRFKADDGSMWDTTEAAEKRDREYAEIERIMLPLGAKYDDGACKYANGGGYVQHDPDVCAAVWDALLRVAVREASIIAKWDADGKLGTGREALSNHIAGWLLRFLDYSGPLPSAISRMYTIDASGREWGQPYYRNNPGDAKSQECVWDKAEQAEEGDCDA